MPRCLNRQLLTEQRLREELIITRGVRAVIEIGPLQYRITSYMIRFYLESLFYRSNKFNLFHI